MATADANNIPTHYRYDSFGRLSEALNADKQLLGYNAYFYSRANNNGVIVYRTEKVTDELGNITTTFFDKFENPVATLREDNLGVDLLKWDQIFDVLGNVTKVNPPNRYAYNSTAWEIIMQYDTRGLLTDRDTPDEDPMQYVYNPAQRDNLVYRQDGSQATGGDKFTVYHYDALSRVILVAEEQNTTFAIAKTDPEQNETYGTGAGEWRLKNFYDADSVGVANYSQGRLSVTHVNIDADNDPEHILKFVYDKFGNLTEKHVQIDIGTTGAISNKITRFVYDNLGREVQVIYPSGNTVVKQYGHAGRLIKVITVQ